MDSIEELRFEIDTQNVPVVVSDTFNKLKELREKAEVSIQKAEDVQEKAQAAGEKSAGAFKKKEAIASLQSVTIDLAGAQIASAEAQQAIFDYQQDVIKLMKFLLGLGASNISLNRSIIRELELRLKGASEEELDEFARQELLGVVKELKTQEDMMKKQMDLASHIQEHDKMLEEISATDEAQDDEITRQAKVDSELDFRIKESEKKDSEQDNDIAEQAIKDAEHDQLIAMLSKEIELLKGNSSSNNIKSTIALAISIISVLLVIFRFFLEKQ